MGGRASDYDIIIIGAGAAGLGALWRLRGRPATHLAVEARNRVGGRGWTFVPEPGLPLDLGCGWIHSADRNPLVPLVREAGFTLDTTPPAWGHQAGGRGFSPSEQREFAAALDAFEARLDAAAKAGKDGPASDWLETGNRWNALIDAFSSFYNGAEFDAVSVQDYGRYSDSGVNWRVREGYGAFLTALGAQSPVRLGAPVSMIDVRGKVIRIETAEGILSSRAAIVTLPTDLVARERLVFRPALPDKLEAAARLPLGLANKLFLAIDRPEILPESGHLFGRIDRTATGSYHTRPFGRPYIEAFFGGANARALEQEGGRALEAFALEELAGLFGSEIRCHLRFLASTAWASDPFAAGAYSHALPGFADARAYLAAPVEDRLFFAGEACSPHYFSTAHGAFETGVAAADRALAALRQG